MQTIQGLAESMDRMERQRESQGRKLEDISTTMHSVNTRLAVIESASLTVKIEHLEQRVMLVEMEAREKLGAVKGMDALRRWAPTGVAVVAAVVFLIKSGAITL